MNRRNAILALMFGAPAAAIGIMAAPPLAAGACSFTGESGAEMVLPTTFFIVPGSHVTIDNAEIGKAVSFHLSRSLHGEIDRYNRNPMRQA